MPKGIKNGSRKQLFIEKLIFRKPCFYYCKSMVLEVPGVQKSMKNQSKNDAKTSIEKVMQKTCKMMQ
jgi:hypothetical protein